MQITVDMNLISTLSGLMSIVLGVLAIWLSIHFYNQAKNAEKQTATTLESVKAQTETLKDITSKQMTRLIKGVTEVKPNEEMITQLISVIKLMPDNYALQLKDIQLEQITTETVTAYIALYYYCGLTNVASQGYLNIPSDDLDSIKSIVDNSFSDFTIMQGVLSQVHNTRITSNALYNRYVETEQMWKPLVKDSKGFYESKDHA